MESILTFVCMSSVVGPLVLLIIALDIKRRGCSEDLTWPKAFRLYWFKVIESARRYWTHKQFVRNTYRYHQFQADLLLRIVRAHQDSAYGRDHQFSSIRSVSDFRRSQPVTEYNHFKDYVDRVASGEESAMFGAGERVIQFADTSGTTGVNKSYPVTATAGDLFVHYACYGPNEWALTRDVATWDLRRSLVVAVAKAERHTPAGHPKDGIGRLLRVTGPSPTRHTTTPAAVAGILSERESHYVQALFALRDRRLGSIASIFLSTVLHLVKRLEAHKDDLVADIRQGRVNDDLDIEDSVRAQLNALLTPLPARAAEVERAFSGGSEGLLPRLWPEIRFIKGAHSGATNEAYYREMTHLCGGRVPITSFNYGGSEAGFAGVIMDFRELRTPVHTLVAEACFFEFLPVVEDRILDLAEIRPEDLLLSHQLEVGKDYELVVTNHSGLYRYRLGDVLRVVGFYNQAPHMYFLYRSGQLLNVNEEKVPEGVFVAALHEACDLWGAEVSLTEYTVAGSPVAPPPHDQEPHYLLFLELEGPRLTDQQTQLVDEALQRRHEYYAQHRRTGQLAPIVVYQVPAGTFDHFRELVLATTPAASAQFKMPRVLKTRERVQWFLHSVSA